MYKGKNRAIIIRHFDINKQIHVFNAYYNIIINMLCLAKMTKTIISVTFVAPYTKLYINYTLNTRYRTDRCKIYTIHFLTCTK